MMEDRSIRDFDWPLALVAILLAGLGALQIYSATIDTVWEDAWWKQIVFLGVAVVLMWVVSLIDYHWLIGHAYTMYFGAVGLLLVTFAFGKVVYGSRRWIPLPGGVHLQVSEFTKLVLILLVARYLSDLKSDRLELRDMLKIGGLVAVPMLLVMRQPDLGTSLTYLPILGMGWLLAGLRWKYVAAIAVIVVLILPVGYTFLQDYQKARLVSFMDPERDPRGSGYQVIQSKIAVGAGGMWGKGVTKGSQTQLRFLPVPHTDFIFSAFAEEHGFAGVIVGLSLFFVLLMQIVQNGQTAPDRAGMMICMGVAALILFHILVNVGMVVGRMPVTGIPLPLMSYGGSSLFSLFMMFGLVNNVRLRRFVN